MCILQSLWENKYYTIRIQENRGVALGLIRELNTTDRGILRNPQDVHFGTPYETK